VREHFHADMNYQDKMARFLENHDEPRAAATFSPEVHRAAAVLTFLSPGLRFFHQGEFEGRTKRISPHLVRGPEEPVNDAIRQFYERLLDVLRHPIVRQGRWQVLECVPAWNGNWTWDCYVAFAWQGAGDERLLVAVNFAPNQSQCHVRLPFDDLAGHRWKIQDLLGGAAYERNGNDLQASGVYLDEPAWRAQVFTISKIG
jgi:glycosidase